MRTKRMMLIAMLAIVMGLGLTGCEMKITADIYDDEGSLVESNVPVGGVNNAIETSGGVIFKVENGRMPNLPTYADEKNGAEKTYESSDLWLLLLGSGLRLANVDWQEIWDSMSSLGCHSYPVGVSCKKPVANCDFVGYDGKKVSCKVKMMSCAPTTKAAFISKEDDQGRQLAMINFNGESPEGFFFDPETGDFMPKGEKMSLQFRIYVNDNPANIESREIGGDVPRTVDLEWARVNGSAIIRLVAYTDSGYSSEPDGAYWAYTPFFDTIGDNVVLVDNNGGWKITFDGGSTTTYLLTTNVSPSGAGSVSGGGSYNSGATATLTATANSGWVFNYWSGDASGSSNSTSITMNGNKTITANFTPTGTTSYTLSTNVNSSSYGYVTGGGTYASGTSVTVTAVPYSGYTFSQWSGDLSGSTNPTTIAMSSNKSVTANFVASGGSTYTLSTFVSPSGAGTVTGSGTYNSGALATITATANSGWRFDHWSGDAVGTSSSVTVIMNENKTVTANFVTGTGGLAMAISGTAATIYPGNISWVDENGSGVSETPTKVGFKRWYDWADGYRSSPWDSEVLVTNTGSGTVSFTDANVFETSRLTYDGHVVLKGNVMGQLASGKTVYANLMVSCSFTYNGSTLPVVGNALKIQVK